MNISLASVFGYFLLARIIFIDGLVTERATVQKKVFIKVEIIRNKIILKIKATSLIIFRNGIILQQNTSSQFLLYQIILIRNR